MSEENVQVVRRIVEAHQRGDFATVFAAYDPAIEWRTSGVELEWNSYAQVWTIRDGKVIRVQFFANRDDALDAAGRSELL